MPGRVPVGSAQRLRDDVRRCRERAAPPAGLDHAYHRGVPVAVVKALCIDATDPGLVARFWCGLLGLDVDLGCGDLAVLGDTAGRPVFRINGIPGPGAGKNRVHVDLESATDPPGATRLAQQDGFTVWADPEGNVFCVFPGDGPARVAALVTDSADPVVIAAWWAGVTGAELVPGPDGALRWLRGAAGLGDVLWKFVPVPDARTVENRWHWDVHAHVPDLVAAGARVLREPGPGVGWTVLADPDGNEFCAHRDVADG